MEQEKTCSRCRKSKPVSSFQSSRNEIKKTCIQCRKQSAKLTSEKRKQTSIESHDPVQELGLTELKQIIQETISRNDNNEFFENDCEGIHIVCDIELEEFENARDAAKDITRHIQDYDGYTYM